MNTPFGRQKAEAGSPSDYIQVDTSYVWEDDSNRLVKGSTREANRSEPPVMPDIMIMSLTQALIQMESKTRVPLCFYIAPENLRITPPAVWPLTGSR